MSGSGWPAGATVTIGADGRGGRPYATAVVNPSGAFSTTFFLERQPDGSELVIGRLDLVAAAESTRVSVPFQVQSRRPVPPTRDGG